MAGLGRSIRNRLGGRQGGLTYEVEVVAEHAVELPLPPGTRAQFVLKRRNRLCLTEPEPVGGGGACEWNTRCTQTATLYKDGAGPSWRPKLLTLKVQAVAAAEHGGVPTGVPGAAAAALPPPRTVAKAELDVAAYCGPQPLGPRQLRIQLQPQGVLTLTISTQWLQHYDREREADALTDISFLSASQSVATSAAGSLTLAPAGAGGDAADQDLSGFEGAAASAPGGGGIRAVYPVQPPQQQQNFGESAGASPVKKLASLAAAALRLPRRSASAKESLQPQQQQHAAMQRTVTAPSGGLLGDAAATAGGGAGGRRPGGGLLVQIPELGATDGALAAAAAAAGSLEDADTPTLFGAAGQQHQPQVAGGGGVGVTATAAMGVPPEAWSPIDLQEAVDQLYESDEQPTPKPSVFRTVRRMFGRARGATNTPPLPGTTARQLDTTFSTPPLVTSPAAPAAAAGAGVGDSQLPGSQQQQLLSPSEAASIERESSLTALRRRCRALAAERDEARAERYGEAARAVAQGVEIDKLVRAKEMLLQRLGATEAQLLAQYRDEVSSDLIAALAAARVEGAQREYALLEAQGQLRLRDAAIARLQARLTRAEAAYRATVNAALTPPGKGAPPSPWGAGSSGRRGQGQLSHLRRLSLGGGPDSPQAAAAAAGGSPVGAAAVQPHCGGGPVPQRRLLPPGSSPPVRPLRLHDNPLAAQQGGQRRPAAAAAPGVVA